MVNYTCERCLFETTKKSTYNDHLASKKHLNKINNINSGSCSVISNLTEDDENIKLIYTEEHKNVVVLDNNTIKIKELEQELKMKDLEINNLKIQLQMKDDIISVLKQQKPEPVQPATTVLPATLPAKITKKLLSPKAVLENLTISRKNALTIEDFIESEIYNEDKINKYFKLIKLEGKTTIKNKKGEIIDYIFYHDKINRVAIVPKTYDGILPFTSFSNLVVNIFCSIINNTEKHLCPIYCSDKQRKIFYIKTNKDGWIKVEEENFLTITKLISSKIDTLVYYASVNSQRLCENHYNYYKQFYPEGLSCYETFDGKNDIVKNKIYPSYNVHKFELEEKKEETNRLVAKHLKSSLSEITNDEVVKFTPLKETKINFVEEQKEYEENEEEDEE